MDSPWGHKESDTNDVKGYGYLWAFYKDCHIHFKDEVVINLSQAFVCLFHQINKYVDYDNNKYVFTTCLWIFNLLIVLYFISLTNYISS